jgi:hypothetical protein
LFGSGIEDGPVTEDSMTLAVNFGGGESHLSNSVTATDVWPALKGVSI